MLNLRLLYGAAAVPWEALIAVALGLVVSGFLVLLVKRYQRCPSNRILVIYGKVGGGNTSRCIHGGAAFVLPLIQDHAYLSLEPIQIEIPLKGALSAENIRVNVPSVFTVAIGTSPEVMQNAAIRLLGLNTNQIKQQASDIIFGQLRQVIASMRIEEINRDRDKFLHNIQSSIEPELNKIGLVLINVNITDITDESGYIEAIGRKAASQAVQQAAVDVAQQEKMGQIGVAEAEREKAIQVANANKLREIGTREAIRDQALRIAELDKEQKIGEQSAAFEREARIKDAERAMRIAVAEANAKAIAGEATAQAAIAEAQAHLQVKQAEAYQLGETRKREAEAAVLEAQNRALAKAAIAEAERVEAERRAALEAPAKAEKAKTIVEAEAEAEKRRIEAEGEAAAIYAKLEAEARGQYEILAKKGEGLKRIVEACGGAQQAFQLLMLEHLDHLAQTAATAISNIKFDKVIVWEGGANGTGASSTSHFLQSMARTLPPIMQIMKDIGGVELPEYFARLTPESSKPDKAAAPPAGNADAAARA
ncbi:MAG: SPFH domain-containing protein [Gemmataceae bacterium]|nr:SPFH domain-containing protein [Gemmataceae bacterium]MDW8266695.1 SPFH domain-containing protein [Gemmataceae bacterium]